MPKRIYIHSNLTIDIDQIEYSEVDDYQGSYEYFIAKNYVTSLPNGFLAKSCSMYFRLIWEDVYSLEEIIPLIDQEKIPKIFRLY